jgi:redox-sensitive bicupin YhaK (pirin superfamily)
MFRSQRVKEKAIARIERAGRRVEYSAAQAKRLIVDPEDLSETSPFLRMPEDWFAAPGGFDTHPHRGMQTITIMLDGALEHRDHTGANAVLRAGDVQWMTAGRGVLHSELPHGTEMAHCLQLWLNLPSAQKMVAPSYVDQRLADTPVRRVEGGRIRVYAGRSGDVAHPHGSTWPMALLDIELQSGASYVQEVAAGERTFLYVLDGSARIGSDREAEAHDVVWFQPESSIGEDEATISIEATLNFRAFLFSSPIIDEPVVAGGPFVMNTLDEISQAYEDLRTGRFVSQW